MMICVLGQSLESSLYFYRFVPFSAFAQLTVSVADRESLEGMARGRPVLPEHSINATIASFANVAGQSLISGTAYAACRSMPREAQEALAPELVTHKFTRGPITL